MALVEQIAAGLHADLEVQKTYLQWLPLGAVVPDFHDRYIGLCQHLLGGRAVKLAGDHQCRRRPTEKRAHCAFFLFFAEIARRQQQLITVLAQGVAEGLDGLGKDRPGDVWDDHTDDTPACRGQPAGHQIGHIAQGFDHGSDALTQGRRNLLGLIEVARHADR